MITKTNYHTRDLGCMWPEAKHSTPVSNLEGFRLERLKARERASERARERERPKQQHVGIKFVKCASPTTHYMMLRPLAEFKFRKFEERGSARWSSLRGRERAIVNQTNIGTVSKVTLGKFLRAYGAHMGFSERLDIMSYAISCMSSTSSWTELNWNQFGSEWLVVFDSKPAHAHFNKPLWKDPTFKGHCDYALSLEMVCESLAMQWCM